MDEDSYRQKAVELRQLARKERNVSARPELELLALGYDRLADQAERNAKNKTVYQYDPQQQPKQQRWAAREQQQALQRPKRTR